jgi:hypothetical protein
MTINRRRLLVLLIAALLARLPLLFTSFWYDENYTILLSRLPLERMLSATAGDVHPPLFYAIAWLISHLGAHSLFLRVPSLLLSLACIALMPHLMDRLELPARVQWGVLFMLAFAPFQLHYATEARMYMLMMFLMLAGTYAVITRRWLWTCVTVTALAYTHNWGLFYGFTLGMFALITHPREWKKMILAFGLAAVCWLPWAFTLLWQMGSINQTYWITRISFGQIFYFIIEQVWTVMLGIFPGLVGTALWLLIGLWSAYRLPSAYRIYLLAFLPLSLAVLVSVLWQPVLIHRALIGSSPFIYILLTAPLMLLWNGQVLNIRRALLAMILIAPMFMIAMKAIYTPGNLRNGLWFNDPPPAWTSNILPGDSIVSSTDSLVINAMAQYPQIHIQLLEQCKAPLGSLTDKTRAAIGYGQVPLPTGRVWVMYGNSPFSPICEQERYRAIIGDAIPVTYDDSTAMVQYGVWLIER